MEPPAESRTKTLVRMSGKKPPKLKNYFALRRRRESPFTAVTLTARRYASAVYAMAPCLCLSQVGVLLTAKCTELIFGLEASFALSYPHLATIDLPWRSFLKSRDWDKVPKGSIGLYLCFWNYPNFLITQGNSNFLITRKFG